ncbi:MAG: FkbM family methyltransferase [Gammaproteobacteria bacterium]
MKPREMLYGLGLRPRPRRYGFEIRSFLLAGEAPVEFAVWRHPRYKLTPFAPACVEAIRRFLAPGDFAIDVGAHVGDSTLPMALAAGASGGVFGLEPNPYVYGVLEANARLNPDRMHIYPLMFAATREDGIYEFQYSDPGFCNGGLHPGTALWQHSHFFKLRVQGRNLIKYLEREFPTAVTRIRYIKIDAEGADPEVAESLLPLLVANHPYIKTEIYKHLLPEKRRAYFQRLHDLGYIIHRWVSDEDYNGEVLSESDMQRWPHFDIFAVPSHPARG